MKRKFVILLILVMALTTVLAGCGDNYEVTLSEMYEVNDVLTIVGNHKDMSFDVEYYMDGKTKGMVINGAYVNQDGAIQLECVTTQDGVDNYSAIYKMANIPASSYAYTKGATNADTSAFIIAINPSEYDAVIAQSTMALSNLGKNEKQTKCTKTSSGYKLESTYTESGISSHMECIYYLDDNKELVQTDIRIINSKDECTYKAITNVKYDTGYALQYVAKDNVYAFDAGSGMAEISVLFDKDQKVDFGKVSKDAEILVSGDGDYHLYTDSKKKNELSLGRGGYSLKSAGIKNTFYASK